MNANPYQSPDAGGAGGAPQPWEIGEVMKDAWERFKLHAGVLVFSLIVAAIVFVVFFGGLAGYIAFTRSGSQAFEVRGASIVLNLLGMVIYSFFHVGLVRMWLATARGQTPDFPQLMSGADRYAAILGLKLVFLVPSTALNFLALLTGLLGVGFLDTLFGVLGTLAAFAVVVLQALGLYYADFYVVDRNMGVVDALKQAWADTGPSRSQIFLFALFASVMLTVASLCCGFPVLIAFPTLMVAAATVYLRITGQGMPPVGGPGYGGPGYGGPGYGGPGYGALPQGGGQGYGPPQGGHGGPQGGQYG